MSVALACRPAGLSWQWQVITLDFQSLYPSIMMSAKLGPTTLVDPRVVPSSIVPSDIPTRTWVSDPETGRSATFVQNDDKSAIPLLLRRLTDARKAVQQLMKSATGFTYTVLNAKQLAIKVSCNSVCVRSGSSRPAPPPVPPLCRPCAALAPPWPAVR